MITVPKGPESWNRALTRSPGTEHSPSAHRAASAGRPRRGFVNRQVTTENEYSPFHRAQSAGTGEREQSPNAHHSKGPGVMEQESTSAHECSLCTHRVLTVSGGHRNEHRSGRELQGERMHHGEHSPDVPLPPPREAHDGSTRQLAAVVGERARRPSTQSVLHSHAGHPAKRDREHSQE